MITGELKNKIDSLWDIFAAGGLVNPLDVIEQITYLMFIRDLDDSDNLRAREAAMLGLDHKSIFADEVKIGDRIVAGNQLKWSVFRDFPAGQMYANMSENVFPFIKTLHADKNSAYSKYMDDAIFKLPTPLVLSKVVDSLDGIYAMMNELQSSDARGDVYEYLLSKIAQSGLNGQFRTPRHIIRMMVELMQPTAEDIICDPACGTSGFLVAAGEWLKENRKQEIFFNRERKAHYMNHMFRGYDMDRTMLRIGAMNMMTHGVDNPNIEYRDSLSDQNPDKDAVSLILANPPFKGSLDADTVSADLLKVCKTKKTELLFLALFLRMLRVGGRCACIVPDGVLFGSSTAHKAIRKELVENHRLQAVISMPSGVFKPYAGVSTGILVFTKTGHGGTDDVWFYDMQADGFSLDDKRTPVKENDIPDIIARFHSLTNAVAAKQGAEPLRTLPLEGKVSAQPTDEVVQQQATYTEHLNPRTARSFLVPKAEIVENGYDLSINKYKKTEYKAIEYPPTTNILAEIGEINQKISNAFIELASTLHEALDALNPIKQIQDAMQKLRDHVKRNWWTIALETESEIDWNNELQSLSLREFMEGEYGIAHVLHVLKTRLPSKKLDETLACFEQGLYYPCACAAATIIEKYLVNYDALTSTRLKARFEKLIAENESWVYVKLALEVFYLRYAADTRNTEWSFDKQEPPFLNRNWLLHGRMQREVSQFDCLQLLCALFAITEIENADE